MNTKESNSSYLSFEGIINRKDYTINMLILLGIFIGVNLINFNYLQTFFRYEFLYTIFVFIVEMLKFIVMIAIISTVYRRISDFTDFNDNWKRIFFIFYFFPFLYLNWGNLLNFIPFLIKVLDIVTLFIILPVAFISSIIFAFIKSK